MKPLLSIFTICLLLVIACTNANSDKEKQLLEKENELLKRENKLLQKENAANQQAGKSPSSNGPSAQKQEVNAKIDWLGTWVFEDNAPVTYTLKIEDKYEGLNLCTYSAEGIQTFYKLECRGYDKGNTFELYYGSVSDGVFGVANQININKPALTLRYEKGRVLTYWNQFFNNYVEKGNHSGQVCFKKSE